MMNCYHLIALYTIVLAISIAKAGLVLSGHSVDHHKEREEDGAISPHDKDHYSDSGEHRSDFDHEAILGSVKEAEEFDQLPPEEAKRRLRILLKQMDMNGDEKISRQELKAWIHRSFRTLSEEEAAERLEDVDTDNDGMVSWEEYYADTYGMEDHSEDNEIDQDNSELITDDKILWKAADTNNDNILDASEWLIFTHPEENPVTHPAILEQVLREKDKNKDGAIDFKEYIADRGENQNDEWLHEESIKFKEQLDRDSDGVLKNGEILSWIIPSNDEIADEEVDHLFANSDDDHDDVLTFDEVVEHHDVFVGSEATDYGDHLHNIHHFLDEL